MQTMTETPKPLWRKLVIEHRITISVAFAIALLVFVRPNLASLLWSIPFILVGEALRLWASGHIHKSKHVTQTGPYAICRHPLYLGHLLITIGFLIAANNVLLAIAGVLVFWLIFDTTMANEENYLTGLFGSEYDEYKEKVPQLLPRWNKDALTGGHDWSLVKQHREINNIWGIITALLFFAAIGFWRGSL